MAHDLSKGWDGASIRLCPLKEEDREAIQNCIDGPVRGRRERTELWELFRNTHKRDEGTWAIETMGGQVVGAIGTRNCLRRQGTFEFELAILPPFERQGYGREATYLVLHVYFCAMHYQKVTATTLSYNSYAIRFLKALGFHCEGQLRRMVRIEDEFFDLLFFGMTHEEFEQWERYEHLRRAQLVGATDQPNHHARTALA